MKKFLVFLMAMVAIITASAQDVIVKNDNSTILCQIVEVNDTEVIYLKWSNLKGPHYVMDRSHISNINYQDGRQDKFNQTTSNAYAPGNQQNGASQYNDNALLDMDLKMHNTSNNKIKKYKILAWGVGVPCILVGVGIATAGCFCQYSTATSLITVGGIIGAAGVVIFPLYLSKAHNLSKQNNLLTTTPIYQYEFNLGNGKSICTGVDIICKRQYRQSTLGLGLQYNF